MSGGGFKLTTARENPSALWDTRFTIRLAWVDGWHSGHNLFFEYPRVCSPWVSAIVAPYVIRMGETPSEFVREMFVADADAAKRCIAKVQRVVRQLVALHAQAGAGDDDASA